MAEYTWVSTPPHGTCLGCGTSANDKGFINTWAEVNLTRNEYEVSGRADVIFCADCVLQMSRLVGAATPAETEAFARRELDLIEENEKLSDEVESWRQRFEQVFDLKIADAEPEVA